MDATCVSQSAWWLLLVILWVCCYYSSLAQNIEVCHSEGCKLTGASILQSMVVKLVSAKCQLLYTLTCKGMIQTKQLLTAFILECHFGINVPDLMPMKYLLAQIWTCPLFYTKRPGLHNSNRLVSTRLVIVL